MQSSSVLSTGQQVPAVKTKIKENRLIIALRQRTSRREANATAAKEKKLTMRNSAVLLEGSRCSRVNGRGWRCCQPTLIGYLLCEHHLGKGRTRNMISNANRGQLGCTKSKRNLFEGGSVDEATRKKRNVVPTVKARSISSLLDDGAGH